MSELSAFVPWTLWGIAREAAQGLPAHTVVQGSVLFCDVAGFTPLTAALAAMGPEGAEELTRLVNAFYTETIAVIDREDGDVLRFGGDAMTVLIPGRTHRRALRAAGRMMEATRRFEVVETRGGTFSITMKAGVAYGKVVLGFVGDAGAGYDTYAAGDPLIAAVDAEHRAAPGEVVCHPSFVGGAEARLDLLPLDRGYARLGAPPAGEPRSTVARFREPDQAVLEAVVPAYLLPRAGVGALAEHRAVAVVFLSFSGLPDATGPLDASLRSLHRVVALAARRHGGIVNKLGVGDKGTTALLLFGAPFACERKEEMAVRAAQAILAELPEDFRARAGVTAAPLFSGPVGSPTRREFTVMGEGVNIAARLMEAAAPGQILCSQACARAATLLHFASLEPIRVKGRSEPLAVLEPRAEAEETEAADLVERDPSTARLMTVLARGDSPVAVVAGDAGVGKTALLARLGDLARARGFTVTRSALGPHQTSQPLSAWTVLVRALLHISAASGPDEILNRREQALAHEPAGFRALLNPLLGLPPESAHVIRNLPPKAIKDLTLAMIIRLLGKSGRRLILIDGLQWADPLSIELCHRAAEEDPGGPWRILVASRPSRAIEGLDERVAVEHLKPLTDAGVAELLRRLYGTEPSARLKSWFIDRSLGVPAVVMALVRAVEAAGLAFRDEHGSRVDEDRLFRTAFPETLQGLYLARIDVLPEDERDVLKAASVMGTAVSRNLLGPIAGRVGEDLDAVLARLVDRGLLVEDTWGKRPYVVFPDVLLRDATYESLPFAWRRDAHGRVAERLDVEAGDVPATWRTLAHHYERAGREEESLRYARLAGRDAASRSDHVTALRYLELACRSLAPERVEDAWPLMDAYAHLGRWAEARPILEAVRSFQDRLMVAQRAKLQHYVARDLVSRQEWKAAEEALGLGLERARHAGDPATMCQFYINMAGWIHGPRGRLDEAERCLERALAIRAGADKGWHAVAEMNLGMVKLVRGDAQGSLEHLQRAHREAARRRIGLTQGLVADNICGLLSEQGKFREAVTWGRQAVRTFETFSERGALAAARCSLGQAQRELGLIEGAVGTLEQAVREASRCGDRSLEARACWRLAGAYGQKGDVGAAMEHAAKALEVLRAAGNERELAGCVVALGELLHSLDAREMARRIWHSYDLGAFVADQAELPKVGMALQRVGAWVDGARPHIEAPLRFLDQAKEGPIEERIARLLWVCEAAVDTGAREPAVSRLGELDPLLASWPQREARVRALRVRAMLDGDIRWKREGAKTLSRAPCGTWGLRFDCWLAHHGNERSSLRRARAFMETLRKSAPAWAWERVARFPEVAALMTATARARGSNRSCRS